jgi:hypothetical protein
VPQGLLSSPSADGRHFHRAVILTAWPSQCSADPALRGQHFSRGPDLLTPPCGVSAAATRQERASLEEPSAIKIGGPTTAGPALQAGWVGLAPSEGQSNR